MKIKQTAKAPLLLATIACALPAILLQTVAFVVSYDQTSSNYFRVGSVLPTLAILSAILSMILGSALALLTERKMKKASTPMNNRFASAAQALGFLLSGIFLLLSGGGKFTVLCACMLQLSAIYPMFVRSFGRTHSDAVAILGCLPVLSSAVLAGLYYFDNTLEMNAPLKLLVMIGVLLVMIYHLGELRCLLGRPMPNIFLVVSFCSFGLSSVAGLPVLLAALFGRFAIDYTPRNAQLLARVLAHPTYIAGAILIFGVGICAFLRALTLLDAEGHLDSDTEKEEL
jgi:hypothetical protein